MLNDFDLIIQYLERVQEAPEAYISPDVPSVIIFLAGFYTALVALGSLPLSRYADCSRRVIEAAGWCNPRRPLWDQMRDAGMGESEIVREVLRLRVEAFKLLRSSSGLPEG
jgi:hypothetical protein